MPFPSPLPSTPSLTRNLHRSVRKRNSLEQVIAAAERPGPSHLPLPGTRARQFTLSYETERRAATAVVDVISCNARACLLPGRVPWLNVASPTAGAHDAASLVNSVSPPLHDDATCNPPGPRRARRHPVVVAVPSSHGLSSHQASPTKGRPVDTKWLCVVRSGRTDDECDLRNADASTLVNLPQGRKDPARIPTSINRRISARTR